MHSILALMDSETITVYLDGSPHSISSDHIAFDQIHSLLLETASNGGTVDDETFEKITKLLNEQTSVEVFSKGNIRVENGDLYYKDEILNNAITDRVHRLMKEGLSFDPLIRLLEKLMENPSYRARHDFPLWLEKSGFPITEDGDILAVKNVRQNYFDHYTGKIDNTPGNVVEVDRSEVDDDFRNTCSAGLHICAPSYLSSYYKDNSRAIALQLHPRDLVAFPTDYNNAKVRVCKYKVLEDVTGRLNEFFGTSAVFKPKAKKRHEIEKEISNETFSTKDGKIFTAKEILQLVDESESYSQIEREHGIPRRTLGRWLSRIDEIPTNDNAKIEEF